MSSLPLVQTIVSFVTTTMTVIGLPGLFALMVVESFGLPPLPSEVILPFAGFLVAEGTYSMVGAAAAALAGGLVGSFVAYAVGYWFRGRLTAVGIGRLRLKESDLARVDRWFDRHGEGTVLVGRLLPVIRGYVSYPAGGARMNLVRFGVFTFVGALPFTLALMYAGVVLRSNWAVVSTYFDLLNYLLIALVIAAAVYLWLAAVGTIRFGWPFGSRRAPPNTPVEASPAPRDPNEPTGPIRGRSPPP